MVNWFLIKEFDAAAARKHMKDTESKRIAKRLRNIYRTIKLYSANGSTYTHFRKDNDCTKVAEKLRRLGYTVVVDGDQHYKVSWNE